MAASPSSGGGTFGSGTSSHRLNIRAISVSHRALVALNVARYALTLRHVVGLGRLRALGEDHAQLKVYVVEKGDILCRSIFEDAASLAVAASDIPSDSPETLITSHPSLPISNRSSQNLNILAEEEAYLADEYFKSINEAIPLFSGTTAISGRDIVSTCSRELAEALLLITAKLLGFKFASTHFDLDSRIDQILSATSLQEDTAGDFPPLDLFRKFCLLAFYEFHQFPGQQAWMRIGKLMRLAYWMGLDRLDMIQSVSTEWSSVSDRELQDWKLIWWCVYRLDSYANLSSGTPYEIDELLVNTSFIHRHDAQLSQGLVSPRRLPYTPNGLPELLLSVKRDAETTLLFHIHLITTTLLRQFGRAMAIRYLVPHDEITTTIVSAERILSAIRLALPSNFLNPGRNAFSNETNTDHHVRLVSVLHLHMAQLLAALTSCYYLPEGDDWILSWQRVLEICQNIAGVAERWDSNYTLTVDPAVTFISFTALIFLDIHKKYTEAINMHLISEIENCELFLLLQLEQFASHWKLPSLLIRKSQPKLFY
ncbi:hypothetical protein F53441_12364 [Fusarium austroafricanum]|uniref:Xylanolytic transcriptional activator regulatory domain-containing protein n=1 Tax=Fusarium austroafricanum TaxID=2364996 RepID=A0A8H4NW84_9HYPO|nr:hypothetical protein F53441_12364 [Fusarium austroafricanum]